MSNQNPTTNQEMVSTHPASTVPDRPVLDASPSQRDDLATPVAAPDRSPEDRLRQFAGFLALGACRAATEDTEPSPSTVGLEVPEPGAESGSSADQGGLRPGEPEQAPVAPPSVGGNCEQ
jgi:hypothetical protein